MQLGVNPPREAGPIPDEGRAVPQQPQQFALVARARIRLRDQAREEHAGEEPRVHPIIFLRGGGDGPEPLGVGEVEADPRWHEQVVEPRPERASLDYHLEGAERGEHGEQALGLPCGHGGLEHYGAQPVEDGDGDIL